MYNIYIFTISLLLSGLLNYPFVENSFNIVKPSIKFLYEGEVDVLDKGKFIYINQNEVVYECPKDLIGLNYLKTSNEGFKFYVDKPGDILIIAPIEEDGFNHLAYPERSQFRELEIKLGIDGFDLLNIDPFLFQEKQKPYVIYRKSILKGETYRFGKQVIIAGFEEAEMLDVKPWSKNDGEILYNGIQLPTIWPPIDIGYSVEPANMNPMPIPYLDFPPEVIPINIGRQLFIDDFLIERSTLKRVFHKPKKYSGNPVLKAETELEINSNGSTDAAIAAPKSGGVWWDENEGLFKMWYEAGWFGTIAYATSIDGINWHRPDLGIFSNTNQVLQRELIPDSWTVVRNWDLKNTSEKWTMYLQPPIGGAGKGWNLTSSDGVQWDIRESTGIAGDRSTHFYNPFRKKWIYSLRISRRDTTLNRSRLYHESDDFIEGSNWTSGDLVDWLSTDNLDKPDYLIQENPQLYNFDAVAYESIMLGFFQILKGPENRKSRAAGLPKITELTFAYSRDGFHWDRPDRRAHIEAERTDVWDRGYIQSIGNICVINQDKLWFYYIGFQGNEKKAGRNGMYDRGATGVAILRRDGFASLKATKNPGTLLTRPITFTGKHLFVNLDAPKGNLRAEICDIDGEPIGSFTLENSIELSCDSTIIEFKWKDMQDLSSISGKPVRIRFELTNGSLYSFWVSPDESGKSNGYTAGGGPGYQGPTDTVGKGALEHQK